MSWKGKTCFKAKNKGLSLAQMQIPADHLVLLVAKGNPQIYRLPQSSVPVIYTFLSIFMTLTISVEKPVT